MEQIKYTISLIACFIILLFFILPLTAITKCFEKLDKDWY